MKMNGNGVSLPEWFAPLCDEINRELARLSQTDQDHRPALVKAVADLRERIRGWSNSLAKPDLNPAVREDLEVEYANAKARVRELESALEGLDGLVEQQRKILDPRDVLERLQRLADVMASGNVTMGSLELGRHINHIVAYPDGTVVMKTNKLGVFEGATALLARPDAPKPERPSSETKRIVPRRRGRLKIDEPFATDASQHDDLQRLDPNRFSGLGPEWFWEDTLEIPKPTFWAAEYAAEVVRQRANGMTIEKLAEHFGKTPPTIRHALRIGATALADQELPRKIPRRRWAEDHTAEVMQLKNEGLSTDGIAKRLGKSDTTIRAALKRARDVAGAQGQSESSGNGPTARSDGEAL
jgi:predicted transcriptional regulator